MLAESAVDGALDALEACAEDHGVPDRFDAALTCVEKGLRALFGVGLRSLAAGGSVARGEADALSDLDLWAIVDEPWSQFCFIPVHGVAVDLDLMSAQAVEREVPRTPFYRNVAAEARIILDRDGGFAALQERLAARPARSTERSIAWCRLRPHAVIRDAEDALRRGNADAPLLLAGALFEILALPDIVAEISARRPVRTLAFARRDPSVAQLIVRFSAAPPAERPAILEQLAHVVLASLGGPLRRFRGRRRPIRAPGRNRRGAGW